MKSLFRGFVSPLTLAVALLAGAPQAALAGEFSVTPIRVELKGGAMSETITVTNHAKEKLRLAVRLMEWTQDATGADVYVESNDLVYFPRQMDVEAEGKRLVRVGLKVPAATVERTYRLFIEEQPDPAADATRARVAFYFRFGVPVFLPPVAPRPQPEMLEPTVKAGKLSLVVKNDGNQHFRLAKVSVKDSAGYLQELPGWYSLAGTQRTYSADIPPDVCRKAGTFTITLEGEGVRLERQVNVDPASCA
jgi:fimbrial chaperone protein